jgi:hypothetical protein
MPAIVQSKHIKKKWIENNMNVYGKTTCPECGTYNNMYRPLFMIKTVPSWNEVHCWGCGHRYLHTDKINNVITEAEKIRQEGKF